MTIIDIQSRCDRRMTAVTKIITFQVLEIL